MTIVVAVVSDDGEMLFGADSAATDSNGNLSIRADTKLFHKHGFTIGFCGSYRYGQIVKHEMVFPTYESDMSYHEAEEFMVKQFVPRLKRALAAHGGMKTVSGIDDCDSFLLVGIPGFLFIVNEDFQVEIPQDNYAAIGNAASVALGSLHADNTSGHLSAREALENALAASERYCANVRGPFVYI